MNCKRRPDFPIIADLRRVRMARGLSQSKLSEQMELNRVTIAKWESRTNTPSLPSLYRWCAALGLKIQIGEQA